MESFLGKIWNLSFTKIAVLAGVIACFMFAYQEIACSRAIRGAETALTDGFPSLASETIDSSRWRVVDSERGCKVALHAYSRAKRVDRLAWAAEACLSRQIEFPEVHGARALAAELDGDLRGALQLLNAAAPKFQGTPILYAQMASIQAQLKNIDGARQAMLKAAEQTPRDAQFNLNALQFFLKLGAYAEARQMADRLRDQPDIKDPEIRLLLGRAFQRAGDEKSAMLMTRQARLLLTSAPERLEALERDYGDLLASESKPTAESKPTQPAPHPRQ